jgi:hypothetical protein
MNLQPVGNAAVPVLLMCFRCAGRYYVGRSAHKMWADLDGPSFKAYYCETCAQAVRSAQGVTA